MRLVQRQCDKCGSLVLWDAKTGNDQRCQCGGLAKLEDAIPLPEDRGHDPYNHHGRLFDPDLMEVFSLVGEGRLRDMTIFEECSSMADVAEAMFEPLRRLTPRCTHDQDCEVHWGDCSLTD